MQPYAKTAIANVIKRSAPKAAFALTEKQVEAFHNISDIVLGVGIVAGTVALTVLAPNIFQYLDKMPWARRTYRSRDTRRQDQQRKITKTLYYLKKKGYVELVPHGEDFLIKIAKKGRNKVRQMQFSALQVPSPKVWNHHWWIVLADIPSKDYRRQADFFRDKLKKMNFYPLQRTVWVYPFDPRDEVDLVAAYYGVERFLTVMEVAGLDAEDREVLTKYFRGAKLI